MKWILVGIIVLLTTIADLLKATGMRKHGEIRDFRPRALGAGLIVIAQNRFIIGSVMAMIISFLAFVALLSVAELSFAVPATAAIFVLETAAAKLVLKESIGWQRWAGVLLIACGIALVSL